MRGVFSSIFFFVVLLGLNGCYTITYLSSDDNECENVIVYYPISVPPPVIDPGPWPGPNPPYPPPTPNPDPQPKIRQPEVPVERKGSGDQVRDPLRGHGNRGNEERKTEGRK